MATLRMPVLSLLIGWAAAAHASVDAAGATQITTQDQQRKRLVRRQKRGAGADEPADEPAAAAQATTELQQEATTELQQQAATDLQQQAASQEPEAQEPAPQPDADLKKIEGELHGNIDQSLKPAEEDAQKKGEEYVASLQRLQQSIADYRRGVDTFHKTANDKHRDVLKTIESSVLRDPAATEAAPQQPEQPGQQPEQQGAGAASASPAPAPAEDDDGPA